MLGQAASSPVLGDLVFRRAPSQCYRRPWPASQRRAFSDLLTGSGAVWSACTRIPHPSGPRQGSPVEPGTIPAWMIASDRAPSRTGPLHLSAFCVCTFTCTSTDPPGWSALTVHAHVKVARRPLGARDVAADTDAADGPHGLGMQ